jgi:hypothetical protein
MGFSNEKLGLAFWTKSRVSVARLHVDLSVNQSEGFSFGDKEDE